VTTAVNTVCVDCACAAKLQDANSSNKNIEHDVFANYARAGGKTAAETNV